MSTLMYQKIKNHKFEISAFFDKSKDGTSFIFLCKQELAKSEFDVMSFDCSWIFLSLLVSSNVSFTVFSTIVDLYLNGILIAFQLELGNHLIPILHKLEQVSSDKHIGTMAENFMEALKKNPTVADKVNYILLSL